MGLPETKLGVVPGAGGTRRLPRLVGVAEAARLIATGDVISTDEALKIGLIDLLAEDAIEAALAFDVAALERPCTDMRPAPVLEEAEIAKLRQDTQRRLRGQEAPLVVIDLVAASSTMPLAEAMAAERAAFLRLRQGEQARALRHIFFAEREAVSASRRSGAEPKDLQTAIVVGGGTMGASIAFALSGAGLHVTLLESDQAALERARARVAGFFDGAVGRGKLHRSEADRRLSQSFSFIAGADSLLPRVDIAIEAVFEDIEVKRQVFRRLAHELPRETILATNASYLDPNRIAEGIAEPSRFLGLHFFAPAHIMKLVEIIHT